MAEQLYDEMVRDHSGGLRVARLTAALEARDAEWNRRTPAAPPELRCDCYETGETEKTCCPCVCHKPAATPGTAPTPPGDPGDRGGEG